MEHLQCKHCGNGDQTKIIFSVTGPHLRATCEICREFIKFVSKPKTDKTKNLF